MQLLERPSQKTLPWPEWGRIYHSLPVRIFYLNFLDPLPFNLQVLDVGCGSGYILDVLQKMQCKVVGLDQSSELIEYLKIYQVPAIHYEVGSFKDFDGSYFDLILCFDVLEHVDPYRCPAFLKELFSWKRDHNSIFISLPFYKNHGQAPGMNELRSFLDTYAHSLLLVRYPAWFVLFQKLKHLIRRLFSIQESDSFEGNFGFKKLRNNKKGYIISVILQSLLGLFRYFPMELKKVENLDEEGTYFLFFPCKTL